MQVAVEMQEAASAGSAATAGGGGGMGPRSRGVSAAGTLLGQKGAGRDGWAVREGGKEGEGRRGGWRGWR
eukprot:768450-Hanusia_phi.AAC.6